MATPNAQAHDLWKKAVDSLDPQVIAGLDPAKTGMRDIVTAVFRVAQTKRDESVKKRWRISRRGKQDIIVRDVMEKIIFWIERFKDVGDNAVQYDPGHAALPWAAVRFILQATVNYTEVEREILEGIELVTRLLASFREVEKIYLGASVLAELQDALVYAYATILETLAEAVKYLSRSKKIHGLTAAFQVAGGENIKRLLDRECQVLRFTRLVDGQRLLDVSTKVNRTAELSAITDKVVEGQKYQAILSWLSATKYLEHHDEQRKLRTPGTGTWLLRHAEYASWQQESSSSILVVHGISGCGKTILSSLVIDECRSGQTSTHTPVPLAFFYCSASTSEPDRRNAASVLRSLVRQLTIAASRYPKIHSAVLAVYDGKVEAAKLHGFDLTPLHVHECEDLVVAALEDNPGTLVVDGLDEMDDPHDLLDSLQNILTKARNVVKIMITTRNSSQSNHKISNARMVQITHAENSSDVERFITMEFDQLALRRKISPDTRIKLVESLVSGAGEMFQWAKLQLSQLQASRQLAIEQDVAHQLSKFAKSTLDELYGTIFEVLLGSGDVTREIVTHALSWILYAQEPLTVEALLTATATGSGRHALTPEGILDSCRGFIHLDSQSRIVRFDHQSVRSFLQSQTLFLPQQAQTLIALSCLRILKEPPLDNPIDLHPTRRPYDYALLYFGHHVSTLDAHLIHDSTIQCIEDFLFDQLETGLYTTIWLEHARATYDSLPRSHSQKAAMDLITSESSSPLFPICVFNMIYVLRNRAWPLMFDWDQRNKSGHTALYAASYFGHAEVIKLLLNHHVDPNVECGRLGSALQCAAYRGHDDVVRVLLGRGADPKLKRHFESAVHAACNGNNEDTVMALLQGGFDISTQDQYDSFESEIAKAGLARAMTELQSHPLSAKVPNRNVQLAAQMIASGEVNGLNYLLRKSISANGIPPGSLAISAGNGHENMTTFLIDQGVSVNEAGDLGTPLRCASIKGHNSICNILLSRGANVDESGPFGSALQAAAMRGHLHTAKLLLDMGADVNIRGGHYGTPLQAAAYHGHPELVQLLLAAKADVHIAGFSKDALHAAAEGGRHGVVQLFLDAGFQPLAPIRYFGPAFSRTGPPPPNLLRDSSPGRHKERKPRREKEHTDSIAPLDPLDLASGVTAYVPIKFKDRERAHQEYNYMLEAGAALNHLDVVATILSSAERPSEEGDDAAQLALMAACRHGHVGIVEMMINDMYCRRIELRKPLREATLRGHGVIVRTLLDRLLEMEPPSKDLFSDTLRTSIPGSPRIFDETLQSMKRALPPHDVQSTLSKCLPELANAGWVGTVKTTLQECTTITSGRLTYAFKRACDAGMTTVASTIYFEASQHARPVSTPQLVRRTRAAAQDGYKDLLQFLLSKCNEAGLEIQTREMICLAAGDGMLEIMTVLLTWSAKRHPTNLLDIALAVGAQNGHQEVCAFLMSQGANPFHGVWVLRRSHVAIKRRKIRAPRKVRKHRDSLEQATSSSGSEPGSDNDDDSESAYGPIAFKPSTVKHDAVQSCLAGFKRFNRHGSVYGGNRWLDLWSSTDVLENEVAQTRTLRTLLDGIANFDEKHWSHKLCTAARSCSPEVLEILLQKGVNARSAMKHENLLQAAAVRERQNHPIMQLLLQAGADQDLEDFDLRNILASSLAQFDDSPRSAGLFPAVQSLEELFVTGCGAVVEYLLGRLPFEDASGNGYAVLLQTAAAAGRLGLVKLLIARNIDVNATGSHYGTALQAACRFVHTDVAEALLQAGADPNLIQGEYCTALRAAVVSESLPMVLLLLQFKADTELTGKASQPTALYLTVREKKHADIAFALLDAGASVKDASTGADEYLPRLLGSACDWGDCSVVRRLIEAGADLQASCAGRRYRNANTSAMHTAISRGHHDVVQLLLYHGFDLTAAFPNSDDFVTFAVRTEDAALITTILRHIPRRDDTLLLQASVAAIEHNLPGPLGQLLDAMQDVTSSALLELCRTACRTPNESTVELLLDRFSLVKNESITSSVIGAIDVRELRAELFDIWLLFFPYSIELFVEACIRGDIALVQRGIDFGHRPDSEDKWARSPFHLAAAQGRTSVVQRLLETGTDVNRVHVTYGTALVTALEGLSADKLIRKSSNDPDRSYATELAELENLKCSDFVYTNSSMLGFWRPSMRKVPFSKPRTVRASATEYGKTVSLLLSNGARADNPPGRFGTALTLAAFAGLIETFDTLIIHGAKINEAGGVLGSCLSAAIDQHHTILVDRLLSMASRSQSISDTEEFALHRACETCNLQIVVKLLELGYRPDTEDSERRTPLKIALAKLGRTYDVLPNTERIVHILMDADTRPILSADELQAAASVTSSPVQDRILDRILDNIITSVPQYKMPEESIIRLLETQKCTSFIEKLLDKKAVTPITTAMLASVYDVEIFPLLLEYDPSYVVTSATIDAIQTGRKEDANEMVEMLFLRSTSLQPTESQMCRAVAAERSYNSEYSQPDKPCLLDLMFTRNSDLHVTQDMLESVRNPTDLGVLLAHVPPGKHVVTDRVLEALTPIFETDEQGLIKFDHLKQRHREELLRIFLDFEPSAEVSPEIAQQFLTKCKLDTLERLLNHDNSIVMLPENVSSMIDSVDDSYDRAHGRFIEMLRKHPDQYEMSDEVKTNVDSRFRQHSEKHLKEMYYKFAGWMDVNEQKREMSEVS